MQLKGGKTERNLKDTFAGEIQANRRNLYFAAKAAISSRPPLMATIIMTTKRNCLDWSHGQPQSF